MLTGGDVIIACSFLALGSIRTYERPEHATQNPHTCFAHNIGKKRSVVWCTPQARWGGGSDHRQGSRECPLLRNGAPGIAIQVVHHRSSPAQILVPRNRGNVLKKVWKQSVETPWGASSSRGAFYPHGAFSSPLLQSLGTSSDTTTMFK